MFRKNLNGSKQKPLKKYRFFNNIFYICQKKVGVHDLLLGWRLQRKFRSYIRQQLKVLKTPEKCSQQFSRWRIDYLDFIRIRKNVPNSKIQKIGKCDFCRYFTLKFWRLASVDIYFRVRLEPPCPEKMCFTVLCMRTEHPQEGNTFLAVSAFTNFVVPDIFGTFIQINIWKTRNTSLEANQDIRSILFGNKHLPFFVYLSMSMSEWIF